MYEMLTYFLEN